MYASTVTCLVCLVLFVSCGLIDMTDAAKDFTPGLDSTFKTHFARSQPHTLRMEPHDDVVLLLYTIAATTTSYN